MDYITSAEAAKKWGLSQRRVSLLCSEGRIEGAMKAGKTWILPESARKPADARRTLSNDNAFVSEPAPTYGSSSEIDIDLDLWNAAKKVCEKRGENLACLVNDFLRQIAGQSSSSRIGIAKGEFTCCDDLDFCNDEVSRLFREQAH